MKNTGKKIAAVILACLFTSSVMVTSCGRSGGRGAKREVTTVSADDPWFNGRVVDLSANYNAEDYDYLYPSVYGVVDDKVIVSVDGSLPVPDDYDWENGNYSDFQISLYDIYDLDGNPVRSLDRHEILEENGFDPDMSMLDIVGQEDGRMKVTIYEWGSMESVEYSGYMDIESGELSDIEVVEEDPSMPEDSSYEGNVTIEGYSIQRYWLYSTGSSDMTSYIFRITDPDGRETTMDLREQLPGTSIFDISTFIPMEDRKVLVLCSADPQDFISILDLNAMTFTRCDDEESSWLENVDMYRMNYVEGSGCFVRDQGCIRKVDFENKTIDDVFRYDESNISMRDLQSLEIYSYSDDRLILGGEIWDEGSGFDSGSPRCEIVILERADTNPNAGKTVLLAGFTDYVDSAAADAVCAFNDSNPDYFIRFDLRYILDDYAEEITDYENIDWEEHDLNAKTAMSNQLAIDLLAGDGPDIIFDAGAYSQLNNDTYLTDISDLIPSGDVFNNVIELCKTGDKLYQLPASFTMQGISASTSDIPAGSVGFTYDEYVRFVDSVCNGNDPLSRPKIDAFILLLSCMSDRFMNSNGEPDFDNEEFRELAEFVNDHITYVDMDGEDYYVEDIMEYDATDASYSIYSSFRYFLMNYSGNAADMRILGLPSSDGRGPSVTIATSVAISSSASDIEGCRQFVTNMLTPEALSTYAQSAIPISRGCFMEQAQISLESFNAMQRRNARGYTAAEIREYGLNFDELDESVIDLYAAMIDTCSSINRIDPPVVSIIREEIQPYFEGQKTLDEVIEIMQDKVRTYVNERG